MSSNLVILDYMNYLEIVGWIATFVVIGSFLINDMLKLRSVNLIGATLWLLYGIIAGSFSIMFLNIVVMCIQVFKICLLYTSPSPRD